MRLQIENIGKIKEADITIDGVTIIAGENSTGKSTIGKVTFCLFDALHNLRANIIRRKYEHFDNILDDFYGSCMRALRFEPRPNRSALTDLARLLTITRKKITQNETLTAAEILDGFEQVKGKSEAPLIMEEFRESFAQTAGEIETYSNVPAEKIIKETISDEFNKAFHSQINFLGQLDQEAKITATVKKDTIKFTFDKHYCNSLEINATLNNRAILIDDPTVLNRLNSPGRQALNWTRYDNDDYTNLWEEKLINYLRGEAKPDPALRVILKEKLENIHQIINQAIDAQIEETEEGWVLREAGASYAIDFANLSYGLRSFIVIKMLMEKGALSERDVLILDEPEIHLHPQWQVLFAQLVVLLQKKLDLSVIITTHSPYFIEAIEVYSRLYGTREKANFYLAEADGDRASMRQVNDNLEAIYKKMAEPYRTLDKIVSALD